MNEREKHHLTESIDQSIKDAKVLFILAGSGLVSYSVIALGLGVSNVVRGNYGVAAIEFGLSGVAASGATDRIITYRRILKTANKIKSLITETNTPARQ